jgi:hypothetical protein
VKDRAFNYYRGSLAFTRETGGDERRKIKSQFLYRLRTWKKRKENAGVCFEIRAVAHSTKPTECHYDYLAYSNSLKSFQYLKKEIAELWVMSGGKRMTFLEIDQEKEYSQANYIHKRLSDKKFKNKRIYLLCRNGLPQSWSTRNFYQGKNKEQELWRGLKIIWYGLESVLKWENEKKKKRKQKTEKEIRKKINIRLLYLAIKERNKQLLIQRIEQANCNKDATAEGGSVPTRLFILVCRVLQINQYPIPPPTNCCPTKILYRARRYTSSVV